MYQHRGPEELGGQGIIQRYNKSNPEFRGSAAHILEDLLAVGQHPVLRAEVVGVGVAGY